MQLKGSWVKLNPKIHRSAIERQTEEKLNTFSQMDNTAHTFELDQDSLTGNIAENTSSTEIESLTIKVESIDIVSPNVTETSSLAMVAIDSISAISQIASVEDAATVSDKFVKEVESVIETANQSVNKKSYVGADDIAKVIYQATNVWSMTGLKFVENTVLLLKNGMAYMNLDGPPGELIVPESLSEDIGSGWMKWREDKDGAIFLQNQNSNSEIELKGDEVRAKQHSFEEVAGGFTRAISKLWGDTTTTTWRDLIFEADGTFRRSKSTLTTAGGVGSLNEEAFVASFKKKAPNESSVTVTGSSELSNSGSAIVVNSSNQTDKLATDMFGTYRLLEDGLSIELEYANGEKVRELFYTTSFGVYMGNSSYRAASSTDIADRLAAISEQNGFFANASWLSILAESSENTNKKRDPGSKPQPENQGKTL